MNEYSDRENLEHHIGVLKQLQKLMELNKGETRHRGSDETPHAREARIRIKHELLRLTAIHRQKFQMSMFDLFEEV